MKSGDFGDRGKGYVNANIRAEWLLDACKGKSPVLDVDFIPGIGDMVHGASLEGIENDLAVFKAAIQHVPFPFYPLMGNHEIKQNQGNPEWESPFLRTFDLPGSNYVVRRGGIVFVMFNNGGTGHLTEKVRSSQYQWLRAALETNADSPRILCCHVPLLPIRDPTVLAESFGFQSLFSQEPEILDLVQTHAQTILAVLSGHLHLTGMVLKDSVYHLCIAGTASYPSDFAVYTVFKDRIEVDVQQIPADLLDIEETDIHGTRRHGKGFVDQNHSTHQTYLMGNPEERSFTIPLGEMLKG